MREKVHIWNIAGKIAEEHGFTKSDVAKIIKSLDEVIVAEVYAGNQVAFTHFGTFIPAKRKARKARNPQTGDMVEVPPRIMMKFRPYWKWKDSLKQAKYATAPKEKKK